MTILEYLISTNVPRGVSEIARDLSLNKISVFRILSSLEEAGWVIQESISQKYKPSENLLSFSLKVLSRVELQKVAGHYLYELTQITGETTSLFVRVGLESIILFQIPGRYTIKQPIRIGEYMPLWTGANGKAMLAFLPADDQKKVFKQLEDPQLVLTLIGHEVDVRKLKEELVKIKEQGYAISVGEIYPSGCAVASPIFGHDNNVIGSLNLRGLLPRFNLKLAQKYAPIVTKTANKISQELGV